MEKRRLSKSERWYGFDMFWPKAVPGCAEWLVQIWLWSFWFHQYQYQPARRQLKVWESLRTRTIGPEERKLRQRNAWMIVESLRLPRMNVGLWDLASSICICSNSTRINSCLSISPCAYRGCSIVSNMLVNIQAAHLHSVCIHCIFGVCTLSMKYINSDALVYKCIMSIDEPSGLQIAGP